MISLLGAFGQLDGYKILCAEAREEPDLLHLGGIVVPFRTFRLRKPVPIPLPWVFPVSFGGEESSPSTLQCYYAFVYNQNSKW